VMPAAAKAFSLAAEKPLRHALLCTRLLIDHARTLERAAF
jgi:hypothetical protein